MSSVIFILIVFAHPAPSHQYGAYEFTSRAACMRAAAEVVDLNRRAYPNVHFDRFACVSAQGDLP